MTRHFLDLDQVPVEELRHILTRSAEIKAARAGKPKLYPDENQALEGKVVALIFDFLMLPALLMLGSGWKTSQADAPKI